MVALYITSSERNSGKTAICAGLGRHLLDSGKKVGFFKPTVTDAKSPAEEAIDSDAEFIKRVLNLEESISDICPIINDRNTLANKIKEAYTRISRGKDLIIMEGIPTEASYEIVKVLDARVIIVEGYSEELSKGKLTSSYKDFGKHLLGVVLNKVPVNQVEYVRGGAPPKPGEAQPDILGVLPEDRVLSALTIGELAEHIQGEILSGTEKSAELVENLMLGAMCVDPGPDYFGRKNNKAVVLRSERPDMQLAALETSTRCLVLSGNTAPIATVLQRAEDKKIPVVLASGDTATIITDIEDALGTKKFNQEGKLPRLMEIMGRHFNFQATYKGLGLAE